MIVYYDCNSNTLYIHSLFAILQLIVHIFIKYIQLK